MNAIVIFTILAHYVLGGNNGKNLGEKGAQQGSDHACS